MKRKTVKTWQVRYAELGATKLCRECFAWVYPEHTEHWPRSEFNPTQAVLAGGLDEENEQC